MWLMWVVDLKSIRWQLLITTDDDDLHSIHHYLWGICAHLIFRCQTDETVPCHPLIDWPNHYLHYLLANF